MASFDIVLYTSLCDLVQLSAFYPESYTLVCSRVVSLLIVHSMHEQTVDTSLTD